MRPESKIITTHPASLIARQSIKNRLPAFGTDGCDGLRCSAYRSGMAQRPASVPTRVTHDHHAQGMKKPFCLHTAKYSEVGKGESSVGLAAVYLLHTIDRHFF